MQVTSFFRDTLARWEGGLSLDPDDAGNWYAAPGRAARLIGSNHGVTGATLAAARGIADISARDMAQLTLDEAAAIAERLFWRAPGLDRLPWDAVAASIADFGWGAGPGPAVRLLQRLLEIRQDGAIGALTTAAYRRFAGGGIEQAARRWEAARADFYRRLVARRPADAKYLAGWTRRAASFLPETSWWRRFGEA